MLGFFAPRGTGRENAALIFWLCRIHGRAADDLAHLIGLLGKVTHLALHKLAVQPHHIGEVLGVQQRLRVIERGLTFFSA